MKYQYWDALFFSLMVGAGETFFTAYALEIGHDELLSGLLATAPIVIGGVVQLIAPVVINYLRSYRLWVVAGAFVQSLVFLALILFDQYIRSSYLFLFSLVVLYWSITLGISPGWNTWMAKILSAEKIRYFFSQRNIIMSIGTLIGLLASGLLLHFHHGEILGMSIYHFIFLLCFGFRFLSFLSMLKYPKVDFEKILTFQWKFKDEILSPAKNEKFIYQFVIFSSLIKLGVYFSASFFAPYMLQELTLSYLDYVLILMSAYCGRVLLGQLLKNAVHRFDVNQIYLISSLGISTIPLLWTFSQDFKYIFILEILTGMMWGGFEIAFMITCFEEIPAQSQAKIMSLYNLIHTLCIGVGCLLGALTFYYMDVSLKTYFFIFALSTALRLASLLFFPRKKIESSEILALDLIRITGVRPNTGYVVRPFWQAFQKMKRSSKNKDLHS